MPAAAIVGAVVATVAAVEATTVVATAFAVAAAIGSTASAIGQLTGVKELTIAGTVLGAVGGVGAIANSVGLFGEAASLFSGGAEAAGDVTQAAVTAAPGPEGGYSWSALQANDPSLANIPSDVISSANGGTSDIVDMLSGTVSQAALAEAPVVADKALVDVQAPAATNEMVNAAELVPDPMKDVVNAESLVPDPAQGLIDQVPTVDVAQAGPVDAYGNAMPQGDGGPPSSPAGDGTQPGLLNDTPLVDGNAEIYGQDNAVPAPKVDGKVAVSDASSTPGVVSKPSPVTGQVAPPPGATAPAAAPTNMPTPDQLINGPNLGNIARADNSIWGNIWDFTKKNPMLLMGGISAATSFLSGAMSPLTPAQTKALDSQAQQNLAAANLANTQNELLQRRLSNMQQGIPQPRWKNTGLVNMAVTGAPA